MKFKYNFEKQGIERLPYVEIIIKNKETGKATGYQALLDSGAFMSVFHSDIAKVLGIDLKGINDEVEFSGVGKSKRQLSGKKYIVNIMVFSKGVNYSFDSYVLFSDDIQEDGHPILGRMGFFDRFSQVIFDYKDNKVILTV